MSSMLRFGILWIFFLIQKNVKYLSTATYGHFTNSNYPWEKII